MSDILETPQEQKPASCPTCTAEKHHEQEPTRAPKKPWWKQIPCSRGMLLDTALVLAILGILSGSGYYLHQQINRYHVPTPLEQAQNEQGQLRAEHEHLLEQLESLKEQAAHAGEQRSMRQRLVWLEQQAADAEAATAELKEQIAREHNQILALQHEIRQEDKNSRAVAKGLLPGMALGDITTTRGKLYRNAVVYRVNGNVLTIRMPEGQAPVRVNELTIDQMPDILRYAFNQLDLINMSDFESATKEQTEKAVQAAKVAKAAPKPTPKPRSLPNYEPAAGAPVVDTEASPTTSDSAGEAPSPSTPTSGPWQAPTGELPM